MTEELKPCPFHKTGCEVAIAVDRHMDSDKVLSIWVEADCGACGPRIEPCDILFMSHRERAVQAWNSRTQSDISKLIAEAEERAWEAARRAYLSTGQFAYLTIADWRKSNGREKEGSK